MNLDDLAYNLAQQAQEIEDTEIAELQSQLDAAKKKVTKLRKAADLLLDTQPTSKKSFKKSTWKPRPETMQKVRDVFNNAEPEETLNVKEIAERSGLSKDTVKAALEQMRKNEEIRAAGQNGRYGVFYVRMP